MRNFQKNSIFLTSLALAATGTLAHASDNIKGAERTLTVLDHGNVRGVALSVPFENLPVTIHEEGSRVLVTAEVSAGNENEIDSFASATRVSETSEEDDPLFSVLNHDDFQCDATCLDSLKITELSVSLGQDNFQCSRSRIDGITHVRGTCLDRLIITVPAGSGANVTVNGKTVREGYSVDAREILWTLPRMPLDSDKLVALHHINSSYRTGKSFLNVAEAMAIFRLFTLDSDRIEAANILTWRIKDRENLARVTSVVTVENHLKIMSALIH